VDRQTPSVATSIVPPSSAASSVLTEEPEEEVDTMMRVVNDTTYEERISMVGDILGADLPKTSKKSNNFAMSVSTKGSKEYNRLPASAMFEDKFQEFVAELSGAEGSIRAKNPKNKHPLAINKLPGRPKPKMHFYDIGNCPWQTEAPKIQSKMDNELIYTGSMAPTAHVQDDKMREWETINRENVSILSHVDHFIASGQRIFETIYEKAENDEEMTPEMLWNLARQGLAMMFSAGRGVQDLARNSIWEIGEQMTVRRDVFLEKVKRSSSMPVENLEELRFSQLNTTKLFDQAVLDRAIEKTAEVKSGKVQNELLNKVSKMSRHGESHRPGADKGKFGKQSFRHYQAKEGGGRKSNVSDRADSSQGYKGPRFQQAGKEKRGNRGRGFAKQKFQH